MFGRSGWLRITIGLAVTWTIVMSVLGWIYLPRAEHIPHNPEFLNQLSPEASLIFHGAESQDSPASPDELTWTDAQITVRMPNGTRLAVPENASSKQIAVLENDYYRVLETEASAQRVPYVVGMLVEWLLPFPVLLILGSAVDFCRAYRLRTRQAEPDVAVVAASPVPAFWRRLPIPRERYQNSVSPLRWIGARKEQSDHSLLAFGRTAK